MAVKLRDVKEFKLRREESHSQMALAEEAIVAKRTIERMEEGLPLRLSTAKKIAKVLGIEFGTFFVNANVTIWAINGQRPMDNDGKIQILTSVALQLRKNIEENREAVAVIFEIIHQLGADRISMPQEEKIRKLTDIGLHLRRNLATHKEEILKIFLVTSSFAVEEDLKPHATSTPAESTPPHP